MQTNRMQTYEMQISWWAGIFSSQKRLNKTEMDISNIMLHLVSGGIIKPIPFMIPAIYFIKIK